MTQDNAATPVENTATPGNQEQAPASGAAPTDGGAQTPTPAEGSQPQPGAEAAPAPAATEAQVTISSKEHSDFLRDQARLKSIQKRNALARKNQPLTNTEGDQDDPVVQELAQTKTELAASNRRILQAEVKGEIGAILAKSEYAAIPESTKALILKNPASLSQADNLEEALIDIEEFLGEQAANAVAVPAITDGPPAGSPSPAETPAGHETPPKVEGGAAAPTDGSAIEDVTNLTGEARSSALIRNAVRKGKAPIKAA